MPGLVRPGVRARGWTAALLVAISATNAPAQGPGGSPPTGSAREETAVFAAGCYWGVESVFEHLVGVRDVTAGFALPAGRGAQAEAVRVVYDPSRITYRQLLTVFFLAAHDPTQVNRQGPDVGPEYRSVVFVRGETQQKLARAFLDSLAAGHLWPRPIATEIVPAGPFRAAPDQDFVARNPDSPYVIAWDLPRLAELKRRFPALWRP